jgi:hypothetical protein
MERKESKPMRIILVLGVPRLERDMKAMTLPE